MSKTLNNSVAVDGTALKLGHHVKDVVIMTMPHSYYRLLSPAYATAGITSIP